MNYVLINLYFSNSKLLEAQMDKILKNIAYHSKHVVKNISKYDYKYVLIPMQNFIPDESLVESIDFSSKHSCGMKFTCDETTEKLISYSIYNLLEEVKNEKFTYDVISLMSENDFDIFYSDGSSSLKEKKASYGTVKLTEISQSDDAIYDELTEESYLFESYSGLILNATNNIGELTGVKTAIMNEGEKQFQIIISDSEYSIKSFREWIYNWKQNGFKTASKKQILNCELIQGIQSLIEKSDKIYLFKWTKGHVETPFNELCDRLAKKELGIIDEI